MTFHKNISVSVLFLQPLVYRCYGYQFEEDCKKLLGG